MSIKTSEENYKIAKSLYNTISDNFYNIENEEADNEAFLIDQTIDDVNKLERHISRINLDELDDKYDEEKIEILRDNIETFKELVYFVERNLSSMKLFDKIHPVLANYIKNVNWKLIANSEEDAVQKFGRFLTHEDNFSTFKLIINNIIRGSISKKGFNKVFYALSPRISKPKKLVHKQFQANPPEMWSKEKRKKWEDELKRRKKDAVEDKKPPFDEFNDSFVSLKSYMKLNEELNFEKLESEEEFKNNLFPHPEPSGDTWSNCCGASVYDDSDICSRCGEHCGEMFDDIECPKCGGGIYAQEYDYGTCEWCGKKYPNLG